MKGTSSYKVLVPRKVQKQIEDLDRENARRIWEHIYDMEKDPYKNATQYISAHWLKVRVGDYRIAFDIDESKKIVTVTKVAHRREFYL